MNIKNKKYKKIMQMLKEGKGYNEISKECKVSFTTIKKVQDAMKRREYHQQVKSMSEKGKTHEEIAVDLDLAPSEVEHMVSSDLRTKHGAWLGTFYTTLVNSKIDPEKFLTTCYHLFEKNLGIEDIEELISLKEDIAAARKTNSQLLNFTVTLRQQNLSLEKENAQTEMTISENKMFIQEMNKTMDSTQDKKDQLVVEINQLYVEINKKQAILDKVNELDNKLKQDPSYIKIREQFLQNLCMEKSLSSIADGLVEILFDLLRPSSMSFREQNRYYNISKIPNFETFRKVLPHLYQGLLSKVSQIIIAHVAVEKRYLI